MVLRQSGADWMLMPSTKQPPGQRTNAGLRSAMYSARSLRNPLRLFLKALAGNNETKSTHTVPLLSNDRPNFALDTVSEGFNVQLYFVHVAVCVFLHECTAIIFPSGDCKDTVMPPLYRASDLV